MFRLIKIYLQVLDLNYIFYLKFWGICNIFNLLISFIYYNLCYKLIKIYIQLPESYIYNVPYGINQLKNISNF